MKQKVEFDATFRTHDVTVGFTRTTTFHGEWYGSDYDGNRGVWTIMTDNDAYTDVTVEYEDGTVEDFDYRHLPDDLEKLIVDYCEKHEPEPEEESEPDYDDRDE